GRFIMMYLRLVSIISMRFHTLADRCLIYLIFFFFNDTATTEIYTLSLHDALPICDRGFNEEMRRAWQSGKTLRLFVDEFRSPIPDRKSTRLNSSHLGISYAVFCLKKKKKRRSSPLTLSCVPTSINTGMSITKSIVR